jgi:hypothetical protein
MSRLTRRAIIVPVVLSAGELANGAVAIRSHHHENSVDFFPDFVLAEVLAALVLILFGTLAIWGFIRYRDDARGQRDAYG